MLVARGALPECQTTILVHSAPFGFAGHISHWGCGELHWQLHAILPSLLLRVNPHSEFPTPSTIVPKVLQLLCWLRRWCLRSCLHYCTPPPVLWLWRFSIVIGLWVLRSKMRRARLAWNFGWVNYVSVTVSSLETMFQGEITISSKLIPFFQYHTMTYYII